MTDSAPLHLLLLEPYDGGSHARFLDDIQRQFPSWSFERVGLPARAWKFRMRYAAADFAERLRGASKTRIPDLIVASSFLNLAEFRALAPAAIAQRPTLLYFHENQLAYPSRHPDPRDLHFGISNAISALAADHCVFNSEFNRTSFLEGLAPELARAPDHELSFVVERIREHSAVMPVPLDLGFQADQESVPPSTDSGSAESRSCTKTSERDPLFTSEPESESSQDRGERPALLLWNHRWEHDKNPESFFRALFLLAERGLSFEIAVAGQDFPSAPPIFEEARTKLAGRIVQWGSLPPEAYRELLSRADICVSTAIHEFQGLSVIEAAAFGCQLVLPDRLSYPELFPELSLYRSFDELVTQLTGLILERPPVDPSLAARARGFSWSTWRPRYEALFRRLSTAAPRS